MKYAVSSQAGGVGKTTVTLNLAFNLGQLGQKVLAIDLDGSGNLTTFLGVNQGKLEGTIYDALLDPEVGLEDVLLKEVKPNVDLVPATNDLYAAEQAMSGLDDRNFLLADLLDKISKNYDYVLIDCGPSMGLLQINAWMTADGIIIPIDSSNKALHGVKGLLNRIKPIQDNNRLNPGLDIRGFVLTHYDQRNKHCQEVLASVREHFKGQVFDAVIPQTVRFKEATVGGQAINEYWPDNAAAGAYVDLAKEILNAD